MYVRLERGVLEKTVRLPKTIKLLFGLHGKLMYIKMLCLVYWSSWINDFLIISNTWPHKAKMLCINELPGFFSLLYRWCMCTQISSSYSYDLNIQLAQRNKTHTTLRFQRHFQFRHSFSSQKQHVLWVSFSYSYTYCRHSCSLCLRSMLTFGSINHF